MNVAKQQYNCDMIQDLLPLYQDGVCSETSKQIVEQHLQQCEDCNKVAKRLKDTRIDEFLLGEKDSVLEHHAKKEKKRTAVIGMVTAGVLMIPTFICLVCNLAFGHVLDWFFIVLASMLVVASVTVVPLTVREQPVLRTMEAFVAALTLLLLVVNLYTGGNWFFLAIVPTLYGLSVFFVPYVLYHTNLPESLKDKKGLLCMAWDTIGLYLILFVIGCYVDVPNYFRIAMSIATVSVILPWAIFGCVRYWKVNGFYRAGMVSLLCGAFLVVINDVIYWIVDGVFKVRILNVNFSSWEGEMSNNNVTLINFIVCILIGVTFFIIGAIRKRENY